MREVSLAFAPGRWTAVMGASGSGKSTLLLTAAGLLRPDTGRVRLVGHDLAELRQSELTVLRRRHVGFVFQSFNLVPSLDAAHNVELPLRLAGVRPPRGVARDALAKVGLADRAGHRPDQLSGGQQQRVAIARALVGRPEVVFADEPTGALDSRASARALDLFGELVAAGTCLVMVTHDPTVAARADRVVFLHDGQVTADAGPMDPGAVSAVLTDLETRAAA
nr:ABC transporter ATP-binding protein [Cellulomonas denverensis]